MAFFENLFKPAAPPPVPERLPGIAAATAAQVAGSFELSAAGRKLLAPAQTPPQFLAVLQQHWLGDDMVNFLVHALPDHAGVTLAAQSAARVAAKLSPLDGAALVAAQAWLANPTDATRQLAAAAAADVPVPGPGALVAQAAAFAKPEIPADLPAVEARLAPAFAFGAVLYSAALEANPKLSVPVVSAAVPEVPWPAASLPDLGFSPPTLPGADLPKAALPNLAAPAVAAPSIDLPAFAVPQLGELTGPGLDLPRPAIPVPTIPPKVQVKLFWEKYPFIALGLALARGPAA